MEVLENISGNSCQDFVQPSCFFKYAMIQWAQVSRHVYMSDELRVLSLGKGDWIL